MLVFCQQSVIGIVICLASVPRRHRAIHPRSNTQRFHLRTSKPNQQQRRYIKIGNCRCLLSERLLQCWLRSSMTRFRTRLPDQGCDHQASCPPPNFEGGASSRTPAVALILSRVVRFSCSCTSSGSFIARIRFSDVHALLPFLGHRLGQVPSANPDELWREVLTTLV